MFKADSTQLIALLSMLGAVVAFAIGEIAIGAVLAVTAAVFSIGGMFWSAHRQDKIDIAEYRKAKQAADSSISKD